MLELFEKRKSIRNYSDQVISKDDLEDICKAGMSGPSGMAKYPIKLIVIQNPELLQTLSNARKMGAAMLKNANACILVFGDYELSDTWIEDCSIAMVNMHLQASSMGIGSCWIQGRGRMASDTVSTEDFVKNLVEVPSNFSLEAILSLGYPLTK